MTVEAAEAIAAARALAQAADAANKRWDEAKAVAAKAEQDYRKAQAELERARHKLVGM